ncbi:hypothetical protein [Flavobacterium algicola]|uniref:hypothetical protein n=1 Tax=Flavobacterium algicola TaxID=556529 RepID=UPI001EFD8DDD|nr:hypothetical protein [Flavobacterium algicola]MCG9792638.1 hypothetical protein [Flavobacterium algicola]
MNYTIEDSPLLEKFTEFNLSKPEAITFLPENIELAQSNNEFFFADSTVDLRKLLRLNSIETAELISITNSYNRKSADFYGPAVFISLSLLTQNPDLVSIALNLISNYIYDHFKGKTGSKNVKLEIYVETKKNKTIKKINYDGNADGLSQLNEIIKSL